MASNGYKNRQQQQWLSGHRAPLFDGENYYQWKKLMRLHLQSLEMDLWYVIEDGPYVPMKTKFIDGVERRVEARRHELTDVDKRKLSLNSKAMLILLNALNGNEAAYVFTCNSAKEMWQKLEMKHEGAYKDSKIKMLMHSYQAFKMSPNESITDMDGRLTEIINSLESLGKSFTNEEVLCKIFRILPSEWGGIVTILEEKDLRVLKKEELIGSLLKYETKINATKVAESETSRSSDSDGDSDEELLVLVKNLRKQAVMVKPGQSKRRSSNRGGGGAQQKPKCETDLLKCYKCGKCGHISNDCPKQEKDERNRQRQTIK